MARTLAVVLVAALSLPLASLTGTGRTAVAAELDKNGKADAKAAMGFYKQGNYEDAAKVFLKLSIAYPDMLVFVRNLGACYYYLRRTEPALSNLRDYLHRKKDITADDRGEVERWIGELERLRDQAAAAAAASSATPVATTVPPVPTGSVDGTAGDTSATPAPDSAGASSTQARSAGAPTVGTTPGAPPSGAVGAPAGPGYPPPGGYPQTGGYPDGTYAGTASGYPPAPYPGQQGYAPQPGYPGAPATGYAPTAGPPVGVAAQPAEHGSGSGRKVAAWLLGIVGVGGAGLGTYFAVTAQDRFSQVQKKYDPDLEKQGKSYRTGAIICFGAGGAAILAAIIVGASGGSPSGPVALEPMVGPQVAGARLSGRY
jgi:hypothetical protein